MIKFTAYLFALIFSTAAFGADVAISRAIPTTKNDAATDTADTARTTTSRVAVRRDVANATTPATSGNTTTNASVARATTASRAVNTATTPTTGVANRTAVASRGVTTSSTAARENLENAVNTVGRNARVSAAGINNAPSVRRAGISLRPSTAEVGGRATIAGTDIQTGSNIAAEVRTVQSRAATTTSTRETIEQAKERLTQTSELNKSCQEQYNDCMDQFCAVIDANQKRCSCSANLAQYAKVEASVKEANTQLNNIAQRIRYVGLSADEIRAIMTSTEAEDALANTRDTSETRSMLADIEELIKNPSVSSSSNSSNSFGGLDLDFDIDLSFTSDMFNLDSITGDNSSSFSKLRGTDLYNAAKKRCNTVLTQCKNAGATSQQISANYELAIDKDCIAYEQGLNKMNETLASNIKSANLMLQNARLKLLRNQNEYDARGCISALNECMTDDMVCGADYLKCLDPTKRYIDENGKVVLGQDITNITDFMTGYNNAQINADFLNGTSNVTIELNYCKGAGNAGQCIVKYLMDKIGTGQSVTDGGLCRAVLDKCRKFTYVSDAYNPYNDVVVNYVQRAMVNIKSAQQKIISDYASNCMLDIANCYNQQVTQVNSWTSSASVASIRNVMSGACRNVALTCAYAVFDGKPEQCGSDTDTCIKSVSEMFYQSLLCPENSIYREEEKTPAANDQAGYINAHCECKPGYVVYGAACVPACQTGERHETSTSCVATGSN